MSNSDAFDAVVVGAGAAGIGVAVALSEAGLESVLVVDRYEVGASFLRWPREMTFITPSFPTNSIGMLDLNSVAIGTSPAHSLQREHPSGREYATYLKAVVEHFEVETEVGVQVQSIVPREDDFLLESDKGDFLARNIVWATGEFQYPAAAPFPGADYCLHNSVVKSWREYPGDESVVIGGYESGIDAAIHLASLGKRVTVLAREATWDSGDSDPSRSLSTYTRERLATVIKLGGQIDLVAGADVVYVKKRRGVHEIATRDKRRWKSSGQPILATGFVGGHQLLKGLFEERDDGFPLLSEHDESTITPGLFLAGPAVRHDEHVFCFIYKFRQRFAVVAKAIADRLGLPAEELESYRRWGMYLDDLSCCGQECVC